MMYEEIKFHRVNDYASIAHGMPAYQMVSHADINRHIAYAHHERGVIVGRMFRSALNAVTGLFKSAPKSTAA